MKPVQEFTEAEVAEIKKSVSAPTSDVPVAVLDGDELKEVMNNIITKMAAVVSRTMGPYGKNAIIQNMNGVTITKDGWLTSRALNIGKNIAEKSLCTILLDTSATTNVRAGDGTSSTIKVAEALHKQVQKYLTTNFMNVRDLENTLNAAVSLIQKKLLESATPITDENMKDAIHKIAMVSTNWDEQLADIITTIYEKTKNPIIKRQDSGSQDTYYEIINGYDMEAHLILQDTYLTDYGTRTRTVERPMILVFDNTLPDNLFEAFYTLTKYMETLGTDGPNLVIVAKGFTTSFVNKVAAMNTRNAKAGEKPVPITFVEFHAPSAIDRECVLDFCDLVGAEIIAGDSDTRGDLDALASTLRDRFTGKVSPGEDMKDLQEKAQNMTVDVFNKLMECAGACGTLIVGNKTMTAKELAPNNEVIEAKKGKLTAEINDALRDATAKSMVTDSINHKQIRLGKLNCNMGIIHVGAHGSAHLKARNDSVDDAIRACSLAYTSGGYTIGGCYAIPHIVLGLLANAKDIADYAEERKVYPADLMKFLQMISSSFVDAIETVLRNKVGATIHQELEDKKVAAIKAGVALNAISEEPDTNLIEPVMVDYEILNNALSLVITLETTDQYLYTEYEGIDSGRRP